MVLYPRILRPSLAARWFLLAALVFTLQTAPRLRTDSLVNDESWETTNGYCYWTQGETRNGSNYIHPPLLPALHALPLLAQPLKPPPTNLDGENRAYVFYYLLNSDRFGFLVFWPRVISLLLSLGTGWLLYRLTRESPQVSAVTLFLWAFEPNLLGWGTLAKTDSGTVFFALLSVMAFQRGWERPTTRSLVMAGWALGAALTCKLTLLFLPAAFAWIEWSRPKPRRERLRRWSFLIGGSVAWLMVCYSPAIFRTGNPLSPFMDYGQELQDLSALSDRLMGGEMIFLFGKIRPSSPLWAFPAVYFLKTTLALTLLTLGGAALAFTRRIRWEIRDLATPLLLLGILAVTKTTTFRYALPALALSLPLVARSAVWLWNRPQNRPWARATVVVILSAHAFSSLCHINRPISYLNECVPASKRHLMLGDYNFDVGQDFKRLAARMQERGWNSIKLADSTMMEPCLDGVSWKSWTRKDVESPQPGNIYVMGSSLLQSAILAYPETSPLVRGWPRSIPPTEWVGDTLLVWSIPGLPPPDASNLLHSRPYFKSRLSLCDTTSLSK